MGVCPVEHCYWPKPNGYGNKTCTVCIYPERYNAAVMAAKAERERIEAIERAIKEKKREEFEKRLHHANTVAGWRGKRKGDKNG